MEIMRSGAPPVFSRDKSDGVPDNLGKNCLLITMCKQFLHMVIVIGRP